jgi:Ca2+-binding EF-hand superfamily protein
MSMGGIGAYGSHDLSKVLTTLLSRLDDTSADTPSATTDTTPAASNDDCRKGWCRGEARLSSDILNVLLRLQQQEPVAPPTTDAPATDTADATTADPTTTDTTTPDAADTNSGSPIHRLFAAIDADGDGSVTKEEFATFIQAKGGTQDEADKLYALLDRDGDGALSEDQLAEAAKRGHHRHRGFAHFAERLFTKIDADSDGSMTKEELADFVTAKGGTAERADKFFAKADKDGDGAVDQSEFAQAIRHRPHGHRGGRREGDSDNG